MNEYKLVATDLEYDESIKKAIESTESSKVKFTDKTIEKPRYNVYVRSRQDE